MTRDAVRAEVVETAAALRRTGAHTFNYLMNFSELGAHPDRRQRLLGMAANIQRIWFELFQIMLLLRQPGVEALRQARVIINDMDSKAFSPRSTIYHMGAFLNDCLRDTNGPPDMAQELMSAMWDIGQAWEHGDFVISRINKAIDEES